MRRKLYSYLQKTGGKPYSYLKKKKKKKEKKKKELFTKKNLDRSVIFIEYRFTVATDCAHACPPSHNFHSLSKRDTIPLFCNIKIYL